MDVLSSRVLLRPTDLARSQHFYRDVLGLAVYREFGPAGRRGLVFYLGQGLLEVSGSALSEPAEAMSLWLQVRDVNAEHARLRELDVPILRDPELEPWGLIEMWVADPDGVRIAIVEVPESHPLRRDQR